MISSIAQLVYAQARRKPDRTAFVEALSGRKITYKELACSIDSGAGYLASNGLVRGDRVGLVSKNSIDLVSALFSVSAAGCIPVPINYALSTAGMSARVRQCAAKALFYGPGFEDLARRVSSEVRSVRFKFSRLPAPSRTLTAPAIRPADPAVIMFTSGSTGTPLGVMLSHRNILANAVSVASYTAIRPSDRMMCVLPFCYIYGLSLVFSHLLAGASVIIDNSFAYPGVVLDDMERFRATGFAGVSSHYSILLRHSDIKKRRLPALRYFMQAGDAMPPAVTKELHTTFPRKKIFIMYGLTEAAPRLTYLDPALVGRKPSSVGKPVPGVKVRIIDERGRERPAGSDGEITAKGDNIMMGYWRNKRQTARTLKNGWLYTGDIGRKDPDGDIFITGRREGLIKIGGHKINLTAIESAATRYDNVEEAAAVSAWDDIMGRRVVLFVRTSTSASLSISGLRDHCACVLPAGFDRFIDIKVLPSFPKTVYGKTDRTALEERI